MDPGIGVGAVQGQALVAALVVVTAAGIWWWRRRMVEETENPARVAANQYRALSSWRLPAARRRARRTKITHADERPSWLPESGARQCDIDPTRWSLSIEQWLCFMNECRQTCRWQELIAEKGEGAINMYDVRDAFVVPWSRGTGSSIALLMNPAPGTVQLMISHAWAGSVAETYTALRVAVYNDRSFPPDATVFFCTLSMYQPEDLSECSISAQLALNPFARIISTEPEYGVTVIHTTLYEVYRRLWTVHELDEADVAELTVRGLADLDKYQERQFSEGLIDTREGECREEDRQLLTEQITSRGGFERLNTKVAKFRSKLRREWQETYIENMQSVKLENVPLLCETCTNCGWGMEAGSTVCESCGEKLKPRTHWWRDPEFIRMRQSAEQGALPPQGYWTSSPWPPAKECLRDMYWDARLKMVYKSVKG